jgi:hypothetical protein
VTGRADLKQKFIICMGILLTIPALIKRERESCRFIDAVQKVIKGFNATFNNILRAWVAH